MKRQASNAGFPAELPLTPIMTRALTITRFGRFRTEAGPPRPLQPPSAGEDGYGYESRPWHPGIPSRRSPGSLGHDSLVRTAMKEREIMLTMLGLYLAFCVYVIWRLYW